MKNKIWYRIWKLQKLHTQKQNLSINRSVIWFWKWWHTGLWGEQSKFITRLSLYNGNLAQLNVTRMLQCNDYCKKSKFGVGCDKKQFEHYSKIVSNSIKFVLFSLSQLMTGIELRRYKTNLVHTALQS